MEKLKYYILSFLVSTIVVFPLEAQIKHAEREVTDKVAEATPDTLSQLLQQMRKELDEMRSNESNLLMEVERWKLQAFSSDSLRLAKQRSRIDSIRNRTKGVAVVVEGDSLFFLYVKRGGLSPALRAEQVSEKISKLGRVYNLQPDSVYIESTDIVTEIMYEDKVLVSFTDQDGLWENLSRDDLARKYRTVIVQKLDEMKAEHSLWSLGKQILSFLAVVVIQILLIKLINWLYRKLKRRITRLKHSRLKPVVFHDYELFNIKSQVRMLVILANLGRYLLFLLQLVITIPILFYIFPQTEDLAWKIFSYIWTPVRSILKSIVEYIPNLFTIFVIYFVIKYVVKGLRYFADEIENEKLKIGGFYADWAQPTFHIVRFLLYAFMVALIYPYLPNSDSGVFQGISVFVGLIVSLGSSTVIANIIAGLVITYMRPFKIGDQIKLNDTLGNVIEKTPFVTRLKTPKNEVVTIPNSFIMSSHTTNYSASARNYGLIIHAEISIGYDVPWRKVHQLLIDSARSTPGVLAAPEPFVLETALNDWYPVYQINAYINDADRLAAIYSDLYQQIQDHFNAADIEIMSPHYIAQRDGNESTIPKEE